MKRSLHHLNRQSVLAVLDEYVRLGRSEFLARHGFGSARGYFVRHPVTGELCDSKAIAGVAYGLQFPDEGTLSPSEFSGGLATVAKVLRALNFEVVDDSEDSPQAAQGAGPWTRQEVELLAADYLAMLALELAGQSYNKAERRRALRPLLNGRSDASIEFKHRNLSAVMARLGLPRIRGYLPAEHAQEGLLADVVADLLPNLPMFETAAMAAVDLPAMEAPTTDYSLVKADAPVRRERVQEPALPYIRRAVRRDYLQREAHNRALGLAGEKFIVDFERWRLLGLGLGQLADRVEHKSQTEGDGLGYDVLSFEMDGTERFIEVKTTAFTQDTPFYLSHSELEFSHRESERFRLCRVFDFRLAPRFFELAGPVSQHVYLDPATYRASLS